MVGSKIVRSKQRCVAEGLGDVLTGSLSTPEWRARFAVVLAESFRGRLRPTVETATCSSRQKPPPFLTETTNNDSYKRGRRFYCELHHPHCPLKSKFEFMRKDAYETRTSRVRQNQGNTRISRFEKLGGWRISRSAQHRRFQPAI